MNEHEDVGVWDLYLEAPTQLVVETRKPTREEVAHERACVEWLAKALAKAPARARPRP